MSTKLAVTMLVGVKDNMLLLPEGLCLAGDLYLVCSGVTATIEAGQEGEAHYVSGEAMLVMPESLTIRGELPRKCIRPGDDRKILEADRIVARII